MPEFRLDRIVSLAVARPLLRLTGKGGRAAIPILMYHEIRDRKGKRHPYFETATSLERFSEQMRYLHDNGYRSVGLDVATGDCHLAAEPGRRVVITFDDGYRDFYTEAAPVLARYGLTATVFVVSEWAQRANPLGNSECMTWSEIREIARNGITIGSHTVSHCELRTLASSCLFYEVSESKRMIEDALGTAIDSFAYPFAFPEKDHDLKMRLRSHLQACGYQRGVCTSIGTVQRGSDPFFLPRIPVNIHDDIGLFEAKLNGAYDWLRIPQNGYKYAKTRLRAAKSINRRSVQRFGYPSHAELCQHHSCSK